MRDCYFSRNIWHHIGFSDINFFEIQNVVEWLKKGTTGPQAAFFASGLWWVWRCRNVMSISNEQMTIHRVAVNIQNSVEDIKRLFQPGLAVQLERHIRWNNNNFDGDILNVDGSCIGTPSRAGFGGLIRNTSGYYLAGTRMLSSEGCSEATLFRSNSVQKQLCSEATQFRRLFRSNSVQKQLCSEATQFRRLFRSNSVQKQLCSEATQFRRLFRSNSVQKQPSSEGCSEANKFRSNLVQKVVQKQPVQKQPSSEGCSEANKFRSNLVQKVVQKQPSSEDCSEAT
ncbi:hypothetical protein MTR_5g049720 [Medicago truncatula]|uniref:Uncharacterized protein n=1 Tax=Medicago truncatula TaxID=3880 RepID=A0A072UDU2_MEDTR|nr:hypothetical protein MTR_5g049720 [Medicago truncatula]